MLFLFITYIKLVHVTTEYVILLTHVHVLYVHLLVPYLFQILDTNHTPSLALSQEHHAHQQLVVSPQDPSASSEWTTPNTSRHGFYRGEESPLFSRSHPSLFKVPTYSEEDLTAPNKSPFDRSKTLSIRSYDTDSPSEL